ncbi:MAG: hypothetical protein A2751_01820 [Candidatus Doudnabacteria bacterium RIFCSPHIGHO2_01_FULL_46_14]|uniref:Lipoprotein signal peptidase n=1 Tax=Candidatus Doudnabacteria bacterium RIFCSPHIGHO2_01_FULL_46_14 TaxID=1817824 RepID=A0A1F5NJN6_9BACT|nr:MAG: hypothetical protein A2751_01820 [Candidatus Doudnabacteria bacterium RIFCSPHIGHO2_01_FULL_46_14]
MTKLSSIFSIAVFVAADQAIKFFLSLQNYRIVKNSGLPFAINLPGFFDLYFVTLCLVVFISLYLFYFRKTSMGFALILGGAFSNLFDRIYFGYVRDFIDIGFATLNLADIMIWVGVLLLFKSQIPNTKSQTNSKIQ